MRIELESLEINGLRDFGINQSIEMPRNSVVSVIGTNKDDGGSNGTGKTTFAMAAPINLFGPTIVGISTRSLKNRHLNVPVRIVGKYNVDGKSLIVDRTLGGRFTFQYDGGEWEEGKSEDVQERLHHILKLTPDQFQFLSSKPQGDIGGFLLMKDFAKKDFLSSFFEVAFVELANEKSSSEIKGLGQKISESSGKISTLTGHKIRLDTQLDTETKKLEEFTSESFNNSITALKTKTDLLKGYLNGLAQITSNADSLTAYIEQMPEIKAIREKTKAAIDELMEKSKAVSIDLEKVKIDMDALSQELAVPVPMPQQLLTRQSELSIQIMQLKTKQMEQATQTQKLSKIEWELESLRKKYQECDSSSCGSCGSRLSDEKISALKKGIADDILPLIEKRTEIAQKITETTVDPAAEEALVQEKTQIAIDIAKFNADNSKSAIEDRLKGFKMTNQTLLMALAANAQTMKTLNSAIDQEILTAKRTLDLNKANVEMDLRNVDLEIGSKLKDRETAERSVKSINDQLASLGGEIVLATSQKASDEKSLEILLHVEKITSKTGFKGYLFDSILEDINSEVNKNLKMIPNANKFSLQFTSDKMAKTTGAMSKAITYQLFSGKNEVELNTLSGGEKLSLIIAVDEAVDTVKSRRLGVSIGWKFLDEQFSWIDENSKEAILEFYKMKSSNKAYFIIDHASEFNAALDTKITIVKENGIAKFAG